MARNTCEVEKFSTFSKLRNAFYAMKQPEEYEMVAHLCDYSFHKPVFT